MVFSGTVVSFSFYLVCLVSVFKYSLFFCLRQWVSVWEGFGSKNWLVLDLVYILFSVAIAADLNWGLWVMLGFLVLIFLG